MEELQRIVDEMVQSGRSEDEIKAKIEEYKKTNPSVVYLKNTLNNVNKETSLTQTQPNQVETNQNINFTEQDAKLAKRSGDPMLLKKEDRISDLQKVVIENTPEEVIKLQKRNDRRYKEAIEYAISQNSKKQTGLFESSYETTIRDFAENLLKDGTGRELPILERRDEIVDYTLEAAKTKGIQEANQIEIDEHKKLQDKGILNEHRKNNYNSFYKQFITSNKDVTLAGSIKKLQDLSSKITTAEQNNDTQSIIKLKEQYKIALAKNKEAEINYKKRSNDVNYKALYDLDSFQRVDQDFVEEEDSDNILDLTKVYEQKKKEINNIKKSSDYENFENQFDIFNSRYQDHRSKLSSTWNIKAANNSAYGKSLESFGYTQENGVYSNVSYGDVIKLRNFQSKTNGYLDNPQKKGEIGSRDIVVTEEKKLFGENLEIEQDIIRGIEGEAMAWKDLYLLNRDPESIKRSGIFAETLVEETARVLGADAGFIKDVFPLTNNDKLENIQTAMNRTLRDVKDEEGNVIGETQFQFTKNQLKNFELTRWEMTQQTIGGILPVAGEFFILNAVTGGAINASGLGKVLSLLKTGKYLRNGKAINNKYFLRGQPRPGVEAGAVENYLKGRYAKGISKVGGGTLDQAKNLAVVAAIEEGKMEFVGMDTGVGAGFAIAGTGFNNIAQRYGLKFSGNLGLLLNAPLKSVKGGLSLMVASEVADPISAAYKDIIGNKSFKHFVHEHYGNTISGNLERMFQNFIAGMAFGATHLGRTDFYNTIGRNGIMINRVLERNGEIFKNGKGKKLTGKQKSEVDNNNQLLNELMTSRDAAYNTAKYFDINLRVRDLNTRFEKINKKRAEQGKVSINVKIQKNSNGMGEGRTAEFGFETVDGKPNYNKPFIRMNASKLNPGKLPHEVFHLLTQEEFKSDPAVFGKLRNKIESTVGKAIPGYKSLIKEAYGDQAKESKPVEYFANLVEFLQNPKFRDMLLRTNTYSLVGQDLLRFFENNLVGTRLEGFLPEVKNANDILSLLKRAGDATLRGDATAQIKRLAGVKIDGQTITNLQKEMKEAGYKIPELFDFGSRDFQVSKGYKTASEKLTKEYDIWKLDNMKKNSPEKQKMSEVLALDWDIAIQKKIKSMLPNSPRLDVERMASQFVTSSSWGTGKRGLPDLINEYSKDVGYGIEKWIGKFYQKRLLEFTKDQVFTKSIDIVPESGRPLSETLADVSTSKEIKIIQKPKVKEKTKEVKITKDIEISEDGVIQTKQPIETLTKNTEWVKDIDVTKESSYKKIESRVNKEVGEIFGVKTEKGNLKASEVKTALEKINELASEIERIMPEGYIPLKGIKDLFGKTYIPSENIKGQGMGIRKSFPELYELGGIKGDVISTGTGRVKTGPGLDPYRKIADTKGRVIREILEIGKHDKITTPIARRLSPKVKSIINWIGKAMTNQTIRANKELLTTPEVKDKIQFHLENIVSDMAAGKPNTLASYDLTKKWLKSLPVLTKIKTISNLIRLVEQDKNLDDFVKKAILTEITFNPDGRIESIEFQKMRKEIKALEDYDVVKLSAEKGWIKEIDRLNKKYDWNIKKNKTTEIDGDFAMQRKIEFDTKILKNLPAFATLPEFLQKRLLDQFGTTYIKVRTTATKGEFKTISRLKSEDKRKNPVDLIAEVYGKEALKGNGKTYKGEFDAAHWQRKMGQKELTERGIDVNIKSTKRYNSKTKKWEAKSPEIKDVIADLLEMYESNKITYNQYFNYTKNILKHREYSYDQTFKANQKAAEALFKPFYKEYKKAKDKGMEVSDIINHFVPLTEVATSISKGFYTITSVPLKSGKPEFNKKGEKIRTHNEHEIQLFNFNKFLIDIITTSKTQTQFNARLKELIKNGEQAIITKELQMFNDSKEQGGQTGIGPKYSGKLSGNTKLIVFNQRGAGDNQLSLLGKKPMTVNEYILDKLSRNEIKKILKSLDKSEISVETVNLSKQVEYPNSKVHNLKLAKKQGVYVGSKDITNSELMRRLETKAQAIANARDINAPKKGASFLDFDDTVAKTKSMIKYEIPRRLPDGRFNPAVVGFGAIPTKGKLTPEQFAKRSEQLEKYGAKFDFSEFNKVIGGKKGPLFEKLVKINDKYGTENTFILTARPAESAPAIKRFLKGLGVDIKLKNIIGLEDGRPGAKANVIVEKAAEGYNDFYFVDDATQNVKAVKQVVDLLGVNGKIRKTIELASKDLSKDFNKILEQTTGVEVFKEFSRGAARTKGGSIGKWRWWLPPSAEGFLDLMYPTFGKGKQGNKHMKWYDEKLGRPYAKGFYELNKAKQRVHDDYEALKKQYPKIKKIINKESSYGKFNNDAAIRTYLWEKAGYEIPELSKTDIKNLVKLVKSNPELRSYADQLSKITGLKKGYVEPSESWLAKSIQHDLLDVSNKVGRKQFFQEWIENKNQIFTEANLNKLEATFGSNYRLALSDMLYRMENGKNIQRISTPAEQLFTKWISNATGTIMFLNRRSALLQTISAVNFMNWGDNNPFAIGKAFKNQKTFWKDFVMIFNSPMLKQRRKGLTMDVNYEELTNTISAKKDKVSAAVAYLLSKGFVFTKYADNTAIAFGGASFYRNRLNTYLKQGMKEAEAKEKAFIDFQEVSEPTQQSSRPDLISQQQASPLGRFVLSFQNVTMQNNRNGKRAFKDLVNKRGDIKTNISKIIYYFGVQNAIFLGMQQALFAAYWDDDATEDDISNKYLKMGNGLTDSILRGSGMVGVGVATLKNTLLKYAEETNKGWKGDEAKVLIEALNISPPVGSKARKVYNAMLERKFNKDSYVKPFLLASEGVTNVPFHRFYQMVDDGVALSNEQLESWQRLAILFGYPEWQVNYKPKEVKKKGSKKKYNPLLLN